MKNVCLILTNETDAFRGKAFDAVSVFEHAGYPFSEVRIFRQDDGCFASAVQACKAAADNVIVLLAGFAPAQVERGLESSFGGAFTRGAADGAGMIEQGEKTLILLSAQDEEYLRGVCLPYLQRKCGCRMGCLVFRAIGADEEKLLSLLDRAEQFAAGKALIRRERAYGEDVIRIFYDGDTPRMLTDDLTRFFAEQLSDNLYALEDTPLEKQLVELLRLRRKKLCVAESFTGGGVAGKIVSVSGASEVYHEGLNTYADGSKMQRLGVSEFTLRTQGAVSEQTAYEMAAGLLQQGNCDVSIATTGLAGPKDDGSGLPIGTCFIAVGVESNVYVYRYHLQGDREEITNTAIRYALFLACKHLKNL